MPFFDAKGKELDQATLNMFQKMYSDMLDGYKTALEDVKGYSASQVRNCV